MFLPPEVTWSNSPLIVTFGAGACARAAGARSPRPATMDATTANVRLMHCLLSCGAFRDFDCPRHHHQQLRENRQRVGFTSWVAKPSRKEALVNASNNDCSVQV